MSLDHYLCFERASYLLFPTVAVCAAEDTASRGSKRPISPAQPDSPGQTDVAGESKRAKLTSVQDATHVPGNSEVAVG